MKIERVEKLLADALNGKSKKVRTPAVRELGAELDSLKRQLDWERGKNATLQRRVAFLENLDKESLMSTIEQQRDYLVRMNALVFCKCGLSHSIVRHPGACM